MDLHGHAGLAQGLERFGHLDLPLVDLEALRLERGRDVRRGDRPVQRVVVADPAADLDLELADPLRDRLGRALLFEIARLGELLFPLDLALVVVGHDERELARQQVVPSIAGRDLHDVAAAAQVFDVLSEDDFHGCLLPRADGFSMKAQSHEGTKLIGFVSLCLGAFVLSRQRVTLVSDVRNQRQLPRARDGRLQRALVLRARPGNPARLDLAPLRDERGEQTDVFIVDVVDLVRAELADTPAPEEAAAGALPLLVLVVLLRAAAPAATTTFAAHRCPSASRPITPSSWSSLSRSPRRSDACGSGGRPRAVRRRAWVALRSLRSRSATRRSSSTRTVRCRMIVSVTRRRRSISFIISPPPEMVSTT